MEHDKTQPIIKVLFFILICLSLCGACAAVGRLFSTIMILISGS